MCNDEFKVKTIRQWLEEFSYLNLKDARSEYFQGMSEVFTEMEHRLDVWESHLKDSR